MRNARRGKSGTWATILKKERELRGLTQDELAELSGVSRWTIMRWESGAVEGKPGHLSAVANALSIDPATAFRAIGWLTVEGDEPVHEPPLDDDPAVARAMSTLLRRLRDPRTSAAQKAIIKGALTELAALPESAPSEQAGAKTV